MKENRYTGEKNDTTQKKLQGRIQPIKERLLALEKKRTVELGLYNKYNLLSVRDAVNW